MESKNTSVIDSLKRLERAGSEHSRTTQKLIDAASQMARHLEGVLPVGVALPRGYEVVDVRSNIGHEEFLVLTRGVDDDEQPVQYWIDGLNSYLHGDFHVYIPGPSRKGVLLFAEDLATGWLDEVSEFLEKRSAKYAAAAAKIEAAKV